MGWIHLWGKSSPERDLISSGWALINKVKRYNALQVDMSFMKLSSILSLPVPLQLVKL
jgi:hypothetical protein|uniref:Uncharacterized protein n=1 Tax=Picea sitchensis TaxID=3332 RepID=A0A6B9XWS6_PICSI|nr:hypothetical protein Q903MT_gene4090 [Picea sitchensis]